MKSIALVLLLATVASAADYIWVTHEGVWRLTDGGATKLVPVGGPSATLPQLISLESDTPPDPPDPTPDLKAKVAAAVKAANDAPNASQLRNLWATGVLLIDTGGSLKQVVTLLKAGQAAQLDTPAEQLKWSQYLSITDGVLAGTPSAADIKQVLAGLAGETPAMRSEPWVNAINQFMGKKL